MAGIPKTKRSGGPRSEAGKIAASQNALKTGAYSSIIVLPDESEEDYLQLQEQFLHDFSPQDVAESAMVHGLAALTWKKLRLERLEQAAFIRIIKKRLDSSDLRKELQYSVDPKFDPYIAHIEMFTDAYIKQNKDIYLYTANLGNDGISKEDFAKLHKQLPVLYQQIVELIPAYYEVPPKRLPMTSAEIIGLRVQSENGESVLFIEAAIHVIKGRTEILVGMAENLDKIREAISNIQQKRLLDLMQLQGEKRAGEELRRVFYKTLSELRRHQEWRFKMKPVDETPSSVEK